MGGGKGTGLGSDDAGFTSQRCSLQLWEGPLLSGALFLLENGDN